MNDKNVFSPRILRPEDANQNWSWDRPLASPGFKQVDFETRVDFQRLRKYRLSRSRNALKNSGLGALLLFDVNNIRYITGTKIGEWERDKLCRFALLAGDEEPFVWDFGSAAVHHQQNCDWLDPNRCLAGMTGMRGTVPPSVGLMKSHAEEIMSYLKEAGVSDMPIGLDIAETAMFFELQKAGLNIVDGQQVMLDAREIKNIDEITLLNQAATMVDGVYHMIWEELKPGVRENDIVALANQMLYEMGSDDVEAINAISGERCSPHPHNFTDRMFRPGDQAFFDILQSYQGYRTCYYRTFNVGVATSEQNDAYIQCREWLDKAIELIKPGVSTDTVAKVWPKAEEFGFSDEMQAFGLQFGHGLGLALHERPIISRLVSLENPMEIKTGMVFALETYCPAKDGVSAARIEEEVVVTDKGCKVISLFPAEDLPIANKY
ncbi:MAG: aminopeptidase [Cellvibrionales bacterium TMED49]|jgi:Xaa-Pro dipeptidase|uniref:M24 family metallopeptidase n=1 Tax=PS1 clade bacterium TaxID=2175152 RepID=A0A368DSX1_9PROT|nr:aminopeptidase [Rhodobiaceae bacterium]OUT75063.1 MAG: aminopeptidase [Rhizobiales bacterium TMED25]OUU40475.1 MAG: aminopeptidase [Cellvibrionales bacterium TMED49]RCL74416.1 MAG: M24 family metallopeptidase [PS1 clade bacterium]MAU86854.1 aminopeptidase [Rhodobiaceae bacterium]|tara:strand:- start:8248 stop:9552 length:1305 start_codon:yes stop_codon:yes gene_type:complete